MIYTKDDSPKRNKGKSPFGVKINYIFKAIGSVFKHHGLKGFYYILRRSIQYLWYVIIRYHLLNNKKFHWAGEATDYYYSFYNETFMSERAVELSIALHFLHKQGAHANILEVGNTMQQYHRFEHDIVDKYEVAEGVINEDIVEYKPKKEYDLIISLSTLEHVGWDEEPKEPEKVLEAVKKMKALLKKNGTMVVTVPHGHNSYLDKAIQEDKMGFSNKVFLKRIGTGAMWKEVSKEEALATPYDQVFAKANAICLGLVSHS